MPQVNCLNCNTEFKKLPSEIKKSPNHFCSRSCSATYNNKIHVKRHLTKECKICQEKIAANLTYCKKCFDIGAYKKVYTELKTKVCNKCNIEKDISFFHKRTSKIKFTYHPTCKTCNTEKAIERHQLMKQKCIEYKGGKCEKCGYDKCQGALDFHHVDPTEKDFNISKARHTSWEKHHIKIKSELDKCQLLCANCHREQHFISRI